MDEINKLSEKVGFKVPLDGFLSVLFGKRIIDIVLFDKKLKSRFEDYKEISMKSFFIKKFGIKYFEILDKHTT
ncbi:hypothetical protein ACFO4P_16910 [Epilithonimonas pallida]|uniref:Uncharacterized protein n=1 Tax=Epilithonimonas pallida TaxID=373671 RepID=A0ABY1R3W1_9FLAO|nr:hypothetical protein [Epilithonimonas pallida]SMP94664.1 hypothetical protein SAMN05421679_10667 [Epilithonimonas pallida]